MKWEDISPELLAFTREPVYEEPAPGGFPLPEELLRNRREWAKIIAQPPGAALSDPERSPGHTASLRRGRRLLPLIGSGIAALLLIGVIGLLARQQAVTSRQLARSQADLARLRDQNTTTSTALVAREAENAALRRQTADAEELRRRLREVTGQLETVRNKPAWPPTGFLLTGEGRDSNARPGDSFNFVAWLRRREDGQYAGFLLPITKAMAAPSPIPLEGKIVDETILVLRLLTDSSLRWPELTDPGVRVASPPRPPISLNINVGNRTFTGTIEGVSVHGKVTF